MNPTHCRYIPARDWTGKLNMPFALIPDGGPPQVAELPKQVGNLLAQGCDQLERVAAIDQTIADNDPTPGRVRGHYKFQGKVTELDLQFVGNPRDELFLCGCSLQREGKTDLLLSQAQWRGKEIRSFHTEVRDPSSGTLYRIDGYPSQDCYISTE